MSYKFINQLMIIRSKRNYFTLNINLYYLEDWNIFIIMITKNLPELLRVLKLYNNPYILCNYKGTDWSNYSSYNNDRLNYINLNDKLRIIFCTKNQTYKIYKNDFLFMLEGDLIIDYNKRIHSYYLNDRYCRDYSLCKGNSLYNAFFHYKS